MMTILQEEAELNEIVQMVGMDALSPTDQPVAGILVFAKTPAAAKDLNKQLQNQGFGRQFHHDIGRNIFGDLFIDCRRDYVECESCLGKQLLPSGRS